MKVPCTNSKLDISYIFIDSCFKMGDKSQYHSLSVGYNKFFIDKRYINLKPCGDGSYGFVASAYDVITGENFFTPNLIPTEEARKFFG